MTSAVRSPAEGRINVSRVPWMTRVGTRMVVRAASLLRGFATILGEPNGACLAVGPKHFTGRAVRLVAPVPEPFRDPVDVRIKGCQAVLPLRQVLGSAVGGQSVTRATVHFLFTGILNDNRLVGIDQLGSFSRMIASRTTELFC